MLEQVQTIQGRLPAFWNRSVIFFANLLSLFYGNDSGIEILKKEVGSLESYGSRLIPILNILFTDQENLLVLEKAPQDNLLKYFSGELNLTIPKVKVLSHEMYLDLKKDTQSQTEVIRHVLKELTDHPAQWVDGYVTDQSLEQLSRLINKKLISSHAGSYKSNNKLLLHEFLQKEKFLLFETYLAENNTQVVTALNKLKKKGYNKAVLKSVIGASGIGMCKIDLNAGYDYIQTPQYLFFEGPCLVQGWLDEMIKDVQYIGSPSVQMFIEEKGCHLYDITDQILNKDSVHQGNVSPAQCFDYGSEIKDQLLEQATKIGDWAYKQGYRGTASVDYHLIRRKKSIELRVCELNARVTGATYPSVLARHFLPNGSWLMRNVRFHSSLRSDMILKTLRTKGLLFDLENKKGILPFNFNTNERNDAIKGQFVFLADTYEDVMVLVEKMFKLADVKGDYDRD